MARKAWLLSLIALVIISLGLFTLKSFSKEQKSEKKDDLTTISEKIDEVLKNQQDIIERLKDIRAQEDIIRVRASRK
jgi:glucosamine 6-phosphate synthetase-like amidotransferase/phosphosugar isomerase protein